MPMCQFLSQDKHWNDQILLNMLGGSISTPALNSFRWRWLPYLVILPLMLAITRLPRAQLVWLYMQRKARQLPSQRRKVAMAVGLCIVCFGVFTAFNLVQRSDNKALLESCSMAEEGMQNMVTREGVCMCSVPEEFKGPTHHFVEIGADNGLYLSNSFFFEKVARWQGMCVEPRVDSYKELVKNRPDCINVNAVISNTPGFHKFFSFGQDTWQRQMSGIQGSNEQTANLATAQAYAKESNIPLDVLDVQSLRFADLFKEHKFDQIEVAFVDVEGAELFVLQTIDFDAVQIHYLVLETVDPPIAELLTKNGFVDMKQDLSYDSWWVNTNWD